MTDQPVPMGATRGAIDLAALQRSHGATPSGVEQRTGGTDELHLVATDATFSEIISRSVRLPMVLVVISTQVPESGAFLDTVLKLVSELDGRMQVISVDVDTNPGLLQALQVRSVPMTLGLVKGQAMPMFQGPVAEDQVRGILGELLKVALQQGVTGRLDLGERVVDEDAPLPPLHQEAFDAIERGDLDAAAAAYDSALAANPKDVDAELGRAQVALLQRTAGLDLVQARAAAAASPDDVEAQSRVADLDVLGGHVEDAFGRLLDLVRRTSGADRDAARTHLIALFAVVGSADERVRKARTALMSALF